MYVWAGAFGKAGWWLVFLKGNSRGDLCYGILL
jgi:hypothetical protein